jgi:hypothetical protein
MAGIADRRAAHIGRRRHLINEELLVHGHGFSRRMLAGLGRCGRAAAEWAVMKDAMIYFTQL